MTSSNRTLNRLILIVLGLAAIILGLTLAAGALPAIHTALKPYVTFPKSLTVPDGALWAVAGGCVIVIVAALVWVFTRGRGGTAIAARTTSGRDQVTINVAVLRDILTHQLGRVADVVGVRVDTFTVRRHTAARIRVHIRRGGDAPAVLDAVDHAVEVMDQVMGAQLPVLIHLTGGTRTTPTTHTASRTTPRVI